MVDNEQVIYDLAAWSPHQRGELVALLTGRGISHDWRSATTLVVAGLVEADVDDLVADVGGATPERLPDGVKRPPRLYGGAGRPAPLALRAFAFLLDAQLTLLVWLFAIGPRAQGVEGVLFVGVAILALYHVGFVAAVGATPGKMAVRLRVVDLTTGRPPGVGRAVVRFVVPNVSWVVLWPLTGAVWVDALWQLVVYGWLFVNPLRRGLHDLAAGTLVVGRY